MHLCKSENSNKPNLKRHAFFENILWTISALFVILLIVQPLHFLANQWQRDFAHTNFSRIVLFTENPFVTRQGSFTMCTVQTHKRLKWCDCLLHEFQFLLTSRHFSSLQPLWVSTKSKLTTGTKVSTAPLQWGIGNVYWRNKRRALLFYYWTATASLQRRRRRMTMVYKHKYVLVQ